MFYFIQLQCNRGIVYKKTDEWYNEWQRVTTSGTTRDNEWYDEGQRVVEQVTTNDSK